MLGFGMVIICEEFENKTAHDNPLMLIHLSLASQLTGEVIQY